MLCQLAPLLLLQPRPIHLPSTQQPPGASPNTSPIMSVTLQSLGCSSLNRSRLKSFTASMGCCTPAPRHPNLLQPRTIAPH